MKSLMNKKKDCPRTVAGMFLMLLVQILITLFGSPYTLLCLAMR